MTRIHFIFRWKSLVKMVLQLQCKEIPEVVGWVGIAHFLPPNQRLVEVGDVNHSWGWEGGGKL